MDKTIASGFHDKLWNVGFTEHEFTWYSSGGERSSTDINELLVHVLGCIHKISQGTGVSYFKKMADGVAVGFRLLKDGEWHEYYVGNIKPAYPNVCPLTILFNKFHDSVWEKEDK